MEKTMLPLGSIACLSAIFLLRTPGGLADISNGMTREFLWFFIPAMTAQFISYSVKFVRMGVGPEIWKKVENYAKKAMVVCHWIEVLAAHKLGVLAVSDFPFWARFAFTWITFGFIAFMYAYAFVMHFWDGNKKKNE